MSETDWPRTVWSEARQVNGLNGLPDMPEDHLPPATFFHMLVAAERADEAALFLAQALPRYEAIVWAVGVVDGGQSARSPSLGRAMEAVRAWLKDPTEAHRRVAGDVAGPTDPPAPETLCALAVFHAGGSIAPPDQDAAPPLRGLAGRFAGAAVIVATSLAQDPSHELQRALDRGEDIARSAGEQAA